MSGEILREKRNRSGKDVTEIAAVLKIKADYLKAIEDDAFERLPIEVYAKGYIREYAKFLNVDSEPIIKAYIEKMLPPETEKEKIILPVNTIKQKMKTKYFLIVIILLAITIVYLIYSRPEPEKPKVFPSKESTPAVQPVQPKDEAITQSIKQEKEEQETKEHVLKISATDTVWLHATIDNTKKSEMILKKGESATLSAHKNFILKIGNAGGIKLALDKKEIEINGKKGQVIDLKIPADKNQKTNPDKKN